MDTIVHAARVDQATLSTSDIYIALPILAAAQCNQAGAAMVECWHAERQYMKREAERR
jgi:hypothetical protein